jgi:hypothetical protein
LGLFITINESTAFESPLDDLASQLESLVGNGLYTSEAMGIGSTKGARAIVEIAIPLAALRMSGAKIGPLLASWLNRPRAQKIIARFDNGVTSYTVTIDGASQNSDQFAKTVQDLLRKVEFPD